MTYSDVSKRIKKLVPELTTIQQVFIAKNIADLYTFGENDCTQSDMLAIIRFLNITGTIDKTQREKLEKLVNDAEKERC